MSDEHYMARCLELASLGMGNVSPNPMVGCVIVHRDKILGEGYHQYFGGPHAEVNAIQAVLDEYGANAYEILRKATVYVNLEPCAHYGKTPPCADLLIRYEVKKVVIGNTDPFVEVNGKGIEKLKDAGIEVLSGVLKEASTTLNRRFFTRIGAQRPYIILKWAQTADGYFAPTDPVQKWISGATAKQLSMQWRAEEDAILVGKKTALIDNPQLTNRSGKGKNPIRLLIDRNLNLPNDLAVFNQEAKTIVFNEIKMGVEGNVHYIQVEDMSFYLAQKIAFQLYLMDIQSVIIEGGRQILDQFIDAKLWDEARIFVSNSHWKAGMHAPVLHGELVESVDLGTDTLTRYIPYK